MSSSQPRSLKRLLLLHESALVLLVVVTGAMGAMWAYFWQQSSHESLRINSLLFGAQQIRGDLYRELKEITRARLVEDPQALDQYWRHLYNIDKLFYQIQRHSLDDAEQSAITTMRRSYELMQTEMNKIFADPSKLSGSVRMSIVDPAYEEWILGDFENAFGEFLQLISKRRKALEENLAYWTGLAPIVIPLSIVFAAGLLLYSHRSLKQNFVQPMHEISAGAQTISKGRLEHKIPTRGVQEVSRLACAINDMARDLAASRDALIESERQAALGALVPVVAHNIRNPMASIRATAQMLDHTEEPDDLSETKTQIIDTVDRLERWVSALLSYLNPLEPHRQVAELSTVTEGALAPLGSKIEHKNLHVVLNNWICDKHLDIDVDLLEQAIHGLLNNAIEASPRDGKITLSIESTTAEIDLLIDDEGSGMRFDPQPTNLSPGPSTKRFGTGLGIPFAFKIVHAHDGNLSFETAPKGGTRVRVSLPVRAS